MDQILAVGAAWSLDVAFFAIILVGILFGIKNGFIKGVCKLAGMIFAIGFAVFFCNAFRLFLDDLFGLTELLTNAIGKEKIAGWLAIAISFVSLVVLIKLGTWLLGLIGTALVEKLKPLAVINRILGGILGLVKALLVILLLLTICKWISSGFSLEALPDFIQASPIVGRIYASDWYERITTFEFLSMFA